MYRPSGALLLMLISPTAEAVGYGVSSLRDFFGSVRKTFVIIANLLGILAKLIKPLLGLIPGDSPRVGLATIFSF